MDARQQELFTEYTANFSADILVIKIMPDCAHMLLEEELPFCIQKDEDGFWQLAGIKKKNPGRLSRKEHDLSLYGGVT